MFWYLKILFYLFFIFISCHFNSYAIFENLDIEFRPSDFVRNPSIPPVRFALVKEGDGCIKSRVIYKTTAIRFPGEKVEFSGVVNKEIPEGVKVNLYIALWHDKDRLLYKEAGFGGYYPFSPKLITSTAMSAKATLVIQEDTYRPSLEVINKMPLGVSL